MDLRPATSFSLSLVLGFAIAPLTGFGQQPTPEGAPVSKPAPLVDGSYQLSTQEVIKVTVFQEDDLTATARIAEDGTVQLPLIGSVTVGGRTIRQAAATIEAALRQDYLVNPQVSVTIVEFAKRRFAILGQVQRPGTYEIPATENLDVIQAVGLAGGYTRSANPSKIIVKRVTAGSERVFRLNGKDLARSGSERAFRVMPGDTITVEESFF
jgi:polysaccharide export outer membrane protein